MVNNEQDLSWLQELYAEHGPALYRLAVMLGACERAERLLIGALVALQRREHRIVDPVERFEFLEEFLVTEVRRMDVPLVVPSIDGPGEELLAALRAMPMRDGLLLVVSHHLYRFGPDLARVMGWSLGRTNQRLEATLQSLRRSLGSEEPVDALSAELVDALAEAARTITWTPIDDLEETLRSRMQQSSRGSVRMASAIVASLIALAIGIMGSLVLQPREALSTVEDPVTLAPSVEPSSGTALTAVVKQLPVYYVSRNNAQLYRELRNLPSSNNLPRMAIEAIMTLPPLDPDYVSLWVGSVREVEMSGDTLMIDLSRASFDIEPSVRQAAIDQMVYTATEITGNPDLAVRFRADGGTPPEGFNAAAYTRRGLTPMPGVWINSPRNQERVSPGNVLITGVVKPDYDAPVVVITDTETKVVVSESVAQTTQTENSEGWYAWAVNVSINSAGSYDVAVVASTSGSTSRENKILNVS